MSFAVASILALPSALGAIAGSFVAPSRTCKNCKWWLKETERRVGIDEAHAIIVRRCDHPKIQSEDNEMREYPQNDSVVQTGSDAGYANFCPGPDFGCIHFTPKEPCHPSTKS